MDLLKLEKEGKIPENADESTIKKCLKNEFGDQGEIEEILYEIKKQNSSELQKIMKDPNDMGKTKQSYKQQKKNLEKSMGFEHQPKSLTMELMKKNLVKRISENFNVDGGMKSITKVQRRMISNTGIDISAQDMSKLQLQSQQNL